MSAAILEEEAARLETLRRLAVLDTPAEAVFDALTTLASRVCGTPIALLSFVDAKRQWFKSRIGLELTEIPREVSFCRYPLASRELFVVENALEDERFRDNPFVVSHPNLRFYAGAPICLAGGVALGTLCVVDTQPRELTREQRTALEDLAALASAQLEARLPRREREILAETTRLNEELTALLSVTDCALSTLELPKLLDVLLERLVKVMKADAGAVLLEDSGRLRVRAMRGFGDDAADLPPIPFGQGFGGRIAVSGEPLYVADVPNDPRGYGTFLAERGIVSFLGVPLKTADRLVGVLHVDWRQPHAESESELHLLGVAADRCASAILNARLFEEVSVANAQAGRVSDRLTLALHAADLGVWDWDVATGRVVWDVQNERIFGVPPGGYDGTLETFRSFVHPDDAERVHKAIGEALLGAPYAISFRIVRPDREVRWIAARGHFQRSPDGQPLRLLGVTEDVTEERHRAEERDLLLIREQKSRREAERAERQIVNILERVSDAFVALDTDWRYTYVSRKAAEIFRRDPVDLLGKHIWTEFPEGIGQPFYKAYHRAAEQQVPVFLEEYYQPYDRWFENRIYPSRDGLSVFFSDVTEKKKTDERLRSTNEQLRALSARVQSVREEESARIAREIHDELGQLLTALRMDVSWMRARLQKLEASAAEPLLARAEGMSELTDQTIRSVQRIAEQLRPAALDQLGLEAAIAAQLAELEARSSLKTHLASTLGDVRLPADVETGVFRIVQELLTNVARHAEASRVDVDLRRDGADVVLSVQDDGRGIRPEEISAAGSLGLVGMRERALLLRGRVEMEGEPGKGTRTVITVPAAGVAP